MATFEFLVNDAVVFTTTEPPYAYNLRDLAPGEYDIVARLTLDNGSVVTSETHTITVVPAEEVPPPETREYDASNAYTQLIMENFSGVGNAIPATALVTGAEILVDYKMNVLSRTRDRTFTTIENTNDDVPLDILNGVTINASLLQKNGEEYELLGSGSATKEDFNRTDFTIVEEGQSEGRKWTVRENEELYSVVIGGEDFRWNQDPIPFTEFLDQAIGINFVPNVGPIPSYTSSGDAAYRFFVDKIRVRVYFDAGSVEYYFASPDKTQVIKGTLVSYYVYKGTFPTGDAEGVLQIGPDLEVMDGDQSWIANDWTIHAAYPPTDANQIGDVGVVEDEDILGMEYNGLPTQHQVRDNRSRYQFITENFYGDPSLNSMYGVHGLERAFAYNGDYFYKIHTQPDASKDMPRSVANHHGHLALGFHGGRVDLSVVGEPYNYDGALGASSWAFGDKVVGLLPLSGTILGVFGSKSIWGISGTTVDNFATQVISPNIGAIEYTITDMGFPIYANAYGIYTLSQTQEYGDYLGTPMSRDVSPWIRPRLLRKDTSDKEVVCAWPVRGKNQYRMAFSDGYIMTMTMNGQAVPTFSKQKYFLTEETNNSGNISVFAEGAEFEEILG